MKNLLYVLCLFVATIGLDGCKKDDPAPVPEVVGKWNSDYVLWSGYVAPYTSRNGAKINPLVYGIQDSYDIKADKTFILTDRSTAVIQTVEGTWEYTNNELTLNYDTGDDETLTYDGTASTPTLSFPVVAQQDTLENPTTKRLEPVRYNAQLIYTK